MVNETWGENVGADEMEGGDCSVTTLVSIYIAMCDQLMDL